MKALVLQKYNHFEYIDVPDPQINPEDVLVQIKACGICGSDVHGMDGSSGRRIPPIIMGHEAAGTIEEIGDNVSEWHKGDHVTFDSTIYCGHCYFCRRGEINLCDHRRVLGVSCSEYRQNGAFAEYLAVPERVLYRLPEEISFNYATMVEPLSIAFHAVGRIPINLNDNVVVVGSGIIGLLVIQALRIAGCGNIIAVDLDQDRLKLAQGLGADDVFNPKFLDVAMEVNKRTGGRGADLVVEAVGIPITFKLAIQCLRKGGSLALIGNLASKTDFPLQSFVTRELTLYGSAQSCWDYPACLDMIVKRKIDVDAMISKVAPLPDGASWFERLHRSESGLIKVILSP